MKSVGERSWFFALLIVLWTGRKPTKRTFEAFLRCYDKGLLIRTTGDIIALSPPLIVEKSHIDQIFGTIGEVLRGLD